MLTSERSPDVPHAEKAGVATTIPAKLTLNSNVRRSPALGGDKGFMVVLTVLTALRSYSVYRRSIKGLSHFHHSSACLLGGFISGVGVGIDPDTDRWAGSEWVEAGSRRAKLVHCRSGTGSLSHRGGCFGPLPGVGCASSSPGGSWAGGEIVPPVRRPGARHSPASFEEIRPRLSQYCPSVSHTVERSTRVKGDRLASRAPQARKVLGTTTAERSPSPGATFGQDV